MSCTSQSTQTASAGNSRVGSWGSSSRAGGQRAGGLSLATPPPDQTMLNICQISAFLLTNIWQEPPAAEAMCQGRAKWAVCKASDRRDSCDAPSKDVQGQHRAVRSEKRNWRFKQLKKDTMKKLSRDQCNSGTSVNWVSGQHI